MDAPRTARERVRREMTREITDIARRRLATDGAAGLSLRAVAREMGMVSSAIHRYFPTKDDLLTALIMEGYGALGEAVERAEADADPSDHTGRWLGICHAIRDWALAHPHEYALLYGSPVPGYAAPQDTVGPAIRDTAVMGRVVSEAHHAGVLDEAVDGGPAATYGEDATAIRDLIPDVSDAVLIRAVTAWTALYGWVSFEVFGQFDHAIHDRSHAFDLHVRGLARHLGLPETP